MERVSETKLLGIDFDEHLTWNKHIKKVISSCHYTLSTLCKLKNFTFELRQQLAESLILSKTNFNDFVYHPITKEQTKKFQTVQLAAASFVHNKYVNMEDIINLKWLPIEEQRTFSLLKLIHKSLNDVSFPAIIKLELRNTLPSLRRQNVVSFQPSMVNRTFQDSAKILYTLPINLQSVTSFNTFCSKVKSFLLGQALAKFTNISDYC